MCTEKFLDHGIPAGIVQANLSTNLRAGTLRGLHYQLPPADETKLVRCTRGALYDVVVDLRAESPTFGDWFGARLDAENKLALVVPTGCAHGFQTLIDDTDALYHVTAVYDPERERGVHPTDPAIGITWPHEVTVVSDRDRGLPMLDAAELP